MKKAFLLAVASILICHQSGHACTVCHSKNPKLVKMHRLPENQGCFTCHAAGLKTKPGELKEQQLSDGRCTGCHKKQG